MEEQKRTHAGRTHEEKIVKVTIPRRFFECLITFARVKWCEALFEIGPTCKTLGSPDSMAKFWCEALALVHRFSKTMISNTYWYLKHF